ncbi:flagellar assembly protein A [Massilia sp. METH4]|uniref:flagellar assembly protein A n=1 Tax=Massilia sp. METH4 TaxID=3123041 RepID=UPI0030D471C1
MENDRSPAHPAGEDEEPADIVQREDGIWLRAAAPQAALQAACGAVFLAASRFAGLDYAAFLRLLYGTGPELAAQELPLVRVAAAIVPFPPVRRALYRSAKIVAGAADYFFEPVFEDPDDAGPAALDIDEFVADMWCKGIRFGIDIDAAREAIATGRRARIVVAHRLDPEPGRDAALVEVSPCIHRSNAPRELADGRFDLHTFENRFPQVKAQARLLRKEPRTPGQRGFELSGTPIEPQAGKDRELTAVAGAGTVIVHLDGHDHLVAALDGFIQVDRKSGRLSIGPKIVGREGVSARTTGNLQLNGEYEEFGEVQENRMIEGGDITIHGDVFGHVASRGGTVRLKRNLVGGSASNAGGAIRVDGVAANAVLRATCGDIRIRKAQNCVISAARVSIEEAVNCEILADEVTIGEASGCAIAGRAVALHRAGPRKGSEMLLFALAPDTRRYDEAIADLAARAGQCAAAAAEHKAAIDAIAARRDVQAYRALSARMRAREVTLNAAQRGLFARMAEQVTPALKELARLSLAANGAQAQQIRVQQQLDKARQRRNEIAAVATCRVNALAGDTVLRTMLFHPDTGPPYDLAPREVKAKLRSGAWGQASVLHAAHGALDWSSTAGDESMGPAGNIEQPQHCAG